jgi:hypothetical protein
MRMYFVGALVLLLAGTVGCGDEETTPLTAGALDDPEFELFMSEFGMVDEGTGIMFDSMLETVNGVFSSAPGGPPAVASEFSMTLEYDEIEERWEATMEGSEEGFTFSLSHTVQFTQGGDHVQYPDPDLLERIGSTTEMSATGQGINSLGGSQAMTVDVQHLEQDVLLVVNGAGNTHADIEYAEMTEAGNRVCEAVMNFDSAISDVQMWTSDTGGEGTSCPVGGVITYRGSASIACTDDNGTASASGSWTVNQSFDETGTMTIRVVSGGNFWEVEESCL